MLKIRRTLILALCAWCAIAGAAYAQQKGGVLQSGLVTPGHAPIWVTSGVIGDGGSALSGNLTELGITNTGTPLCINDAPITGQYHQFCLGANVLGGGLISYNAYGGAPPLPLQCDINGVFQPCVSSNANTGVGTPLVVAGSPVCNNSTDDTAAINARLASGSSNTYVGPTGKICYSATGIVIPNGVTLNWEDFNTGAVQKSGIRCGSSITTCVIVGNNSNGYASLNNIAIFGPGLGTCVLFNGNNNIQALKVYCQNFADGGVVSGDGVSTGIYVHLTNFYTCQMHDADIIINQVPGIYFTNPIVGCAGAFDIAHADYVRVTGNWDNVKGTIHFVDPHLNLGQNQVNCAFNFKSFTGSGPPSPTHNQILDVSIVAGHIEQANNFLCSDGSVQSIANFSMQGVSAYGGTGTHFFALNPATEPEYWNINGIAAVAWNDFTLAPNQGPSVLVLSGNNFASGLLHITATSGGDAVITSNNYVGGVTLDGAGWLVGQFDGTLLSGAITLSDNALAKFSATVSGVNCTIGLQIGGSSTGIVYHPSGLPQCGATLANHQLTMFFFISVDSLGGLTGPAVITGLPFKTLPLGTPNLPLIYANMAGVTGGVLAEINVAANTANLVMPGASNLVALTNANFGSCSNTTPCVIQGILDYYAAAN